MPNAAEKIELEDSDAEALLSEMYAEVRAMRAQKPPSFQLQRLTRQTASPEHLRETYINGQEAEISRKTIPK